MMDLAQVIADARGEAAVLRRAGNAGQADYVDALCDRVRDAAEDFLRWLPERDAKLKSGWSDRTLRRRFAELLESGLARWNDDAREFRACAVPRRADVGSEYERGAKVVNQ